MTTWTQEQSINFECAREAINYLMAIYTSELYSEKEKALPDEQRIETLRTRRSQLAKERSSIDADDDQMVAEVRVKYSAIIRAHALHQGSITDYDHSHPVP